MLRVGGKARILVVDRAHGLAVGGHVDKAALAYLARHHIEVACHGKIAIHALTLGEFGMVALDYLCVAPHGNDALALGCRKEVPIAEPIANYGVSHVIRGDGEAFDRKAHCAIGQGAIVHLDQLGLGKFGLVDMNLLHRVSPLRGDASGRSQQLRGVKPASASAHKALGCRHSCGSTSARPHRQGGFRPRRRRSG